MAAGGGGVGGIADEKAPEAFGLSRHVAEAEMEEEHGGGGGESSVKSKLSGLLWHGGSAYDAWFSCASNQVYMLSLASYFFCLISARI
jgi:auxin influx carrier (AUX1 LAX family)